MRIVALSDTHGFHKKLTIPDGDMLIYVGDFSMRAKLQHVTEFATWLKALPHEHKIIVPGNHDVFCEGNFRWCRDEFYPAQYLLHCSMMINGYLIFGSPYSSSIFEPSPWAFDFPREGKRSKELWHDIPKGTQILVTHGPPKGILDRVLEAHPGEDPHVGDSALLKAVQRVKPLVHLFGHIHEGYGMMDYGSTRFYNVSVCDVNYKPVNPVTVIEL